MPHSAEEKKRVVTRLRRIKGQAEALERAVQAGTDCGELLQQLAALRGAANGLMAEVFASHMRETFGSTTPDAMPDKDRQAEIDKLVAIIRSYLK